MIIKEKREKGRQGMAANSLHGAPEQRSQLLALGEELRMAPTAAVHLEAAVLRRDEYVSSVIHLFPCPTRRAGIIGRIATATITVDPHWASGSGKALCQAIAPKLL